jgi:hypothetical protein
VEPAALVTGVDFDNC